MKDTIGNPRVLAATMVFGLAMMLAAGPTSAHDRENGIAGTYYLALSVDPFELPLPPGLSLPGLLTLHADRTAMIVDGGDFGGLPFDTRDSAQLGSWRYSRSGIQIVFLFLQAEASTGDVRSWQRVHILIDERDHNVLRGKVNVFQLPCVGPAPFGVFNCPDPIESADDFLPNSPPDIPVTLHRLAVRPGM
jgi:hypothetical protein